MTKKERRVVGEIQDLAGHAVAVAENDRSPNRMEELRPILDSVFLKAVELLNKYPPQVDGEDYDGDPE